jgi:methylthioribose-1-phosphate isomerase
VAGAYGVALELARDPSAQALEQACTLLVGARPTAVNLRWAVQRVRAAVSETQSPDRQLVALDEAEAIREEEEAASRAMAVHGADLLSETPAILTHCNTGALAAPGGGTALAVIVELHARGLLRSVLATETRPLLQGARLTAYELSRLGICHQVIVDSAAAGLIRRGEVDAVIVGCDRVAANGDVANKVGTYGLALAAKAAEIPFVVAGPTSTIDAQCPSGDEIPIEERDPEEVQTAAGAATSPSGTDCRNPAFDITPASLVSALVTERGVVSPVGAQPIRDLCASSGVR